MMQHGKETEMQKCIVWLDEHLLRHIDGKFWSQSSGIISPGGYLEALLSPGLLLEVTCLILNHFWRKGLTIKFRKRKLNLFRSFNAGRFPTMAEGCYSVNLSENQIWVLSLLKHTTNERAPSKLP
jgi:hypothetical protein